MCALCLRHSRLLVASGLLLSCLAVHAQFSDVTNLYGLYIYNDNSVWENGVSFHDFDRDGLDDLTYTSNNGGVFTFRNTGSGFETVYYLVAITGRITSPTWVDYDNDGDTDFFATRAFDCPVLWRNNGDMTFEDVSGSIPCPMDGILSTTATWGDYDNDGWLDVHVGNYNQTIETGTHNWLFHNLGNGSFEEVSVAVGLNDGNGKSYQCIFLDADFDRDQDLLVVHDKHFGCRYFRNQDGFFEDIGPENGFDVELDAMSLSVSDFDHDGDYDYYISNIVDGNFFLINDNGVFTNHAEDLNVQVNANCWGAMFIDSKNSTYEDLYVVSTGPSTGLNVLMQNAQAAEFLTSYSEFGNADDEYMWAVAKGDCNNDGSYDVMSLPFLSNGSLLFESAGNSSNWIKIGLEGSLSNRDGIGSTVRCFAEGEEFIRPVTCGENFQSQDSRYLIFGLQNFLIVDSLIVEWPSGITDKFYDLGVNQFYAFTEGETLNFPDEVSEYFLCPGESIQLVADDMNFQSWSNGLPDQTIVVDTPGVYTALYATQWGDEYMHTFYIEQTQMPDWSTELVMPACNGDATGTAEIIVDENVIDSIYWFDGSSSFEHLNLASGIYQVNLITVNGCTAQLEIEITEPSQMLLQNDLDQVNCYGVYVPPSPVLSGGFPPYDVDWGTADPSSLQPGIHTFEVHDNLGCVAEFSFEVQWLPEIVVTLETDVICPDATTAIEYSATGGTGNLVFDFDEVDPDNAPPGFYQVVVTDDVFCSTVQTFTIGQFDPMQNAAIVTNALDGSNGAIQINTSGGLAPYTFAWSNGSEENPLSGLSQGEYSCVVTDANGCTDEVVVQIIDLFLHEVENDVCLFPLPFKERLNIVMQGEHEFSVFDVAGKNLMYGFFVDSFQINTASMSSGMYFIQFDGVISKWLCKE